MHHKLEDHPRFRQGQEAKFKIQMMVQKEVYNNAIYNIIYERRESVKPHLLATGRGFSLEIKNKKVNVKSDDYRVLGATMAAFLNVWAGSKRAAPLIEI
jgi:hypothetical protein